MSEQFWTTTIAAVLAAVPPTITSMLALWKLRQMHIDVNSRLTQLVAAKRSEGELEGRKSQKREMLTGKVNNKKSKL